VSSCIERLVEKIWQEITHTKLDNGTIWDVEVLNRDPCKNSLLAILGKNKVPDALCLKYLTKLLSISAISVGTIPGRGKKRKHKKDD
jgi:hypothetical protein